MKCEDVQSHFSDYLDKTAEGPRAKGIENHLTSCPICSEEFAGLFQCRQLVSGLPDVEPPLGFTLRVMANVAEAANEMSLWKRLFIPLKNKIPLQATAVMLIGILSFYLYQKEDHNNAPLQVTSQNPSPVAANVTATPNVAVQPPNVKKQRDKSIRQGSNEAKSATIEKPTPRTRSVSVATVLDSPPQGTAGSRRSFPIPAQGVVAGSGVPVPMRMPRQPAFRLFPAERLVNLGEPVADYELLVRAGPRRRRDMESPANSAQKSGNPEAPSNSAESGKLLDLQASSVLDILWYTVPQEQYQQFKNELAAQARIESEVPIGISEKESSFRSDGPLFIKVIVLAPNE
jgi:hypothetical protein